MSKIAIFGAGYVGLVTGACFAELGHDVAVRDVLPDRVEALLRGELPIYEPGLDELLERNRERLRFTTDVREALDGADFLFICVGTPPTYSGDADLSAVWTVLDELPQDTRTTVVMKSTVPVGTGDKVRASLDQRGLDAVGYASNPEFTAEGTAVRDFMHPDRIVVGAFDAEDGDAVAALHAGDRRAGRARRRQLRRDDQARGERVPDDARLVHQRDRERLRARRRGRPERRGGDRARPASRPALPARGHRLRRFVLPEGLARAEAARRELGLPLPAAERGHRGERAAEAPRRAEAAAASRPPARQDRRAARARVQAEHGRHARGAVARARVAPARRGSRGARVGSGREAGAAGRQALRVAARGDHRRRRGRDRDRVARVAGAGDRGGARRDAPSADHRRPQPARSRRRSRRRLRVRGHRPRGLADRRPAGDSGPRAGNLRILPLRKPPPTPLSPAPPSGSADPRRRQGRASRRRCGRAARSRSSWSTGVRSRRTRSRSSRRPASPASSSPAHGARNDSSKQSSAGSARRSSRSASPSRSAAAAGCASARRTGRRAAPCSR